MLTRPVGQILAKRLLRQKREAGSWRSLQEQRYPAIPAGTLCRIAREGGAYIPSQPDIRQALGLPVVCPACKRRIVIKRTLLPALEPEAFDPTAPRSESVSPDQPVLRPLTGAWRSASGEWVGPEEYFRERRSA